MAKKESNHRQHLIIRRLQRSAATFAEIQDYWRGTRTKWKLS